MRKEARLSMWARWGTLGLRHRAGAYLLAVLAGILAFGAGSARAAAYLPPPGKVFAGVGPGNPVFYERQTLTHPAVLNDFIIWYGTYGWLLARADSNHMRAMISLMTNVGFSRDSAGQAHPGHELITPRQIMEGNGDAWLIGLGQALARRGRPTYLRIMAEMNGWWNPYCAFTRFGKPRPGHSIYDFRQAWRRIVLILRGGVTVNVDRALGRLGMPPVRTGSVTLSRAPVAFVWNPQTSGDPNIRANSAQAYYPGDSYVDWVGTDFFSKFQNWPGLNRFYRSRYFNKPFALGEWGIWGRDSPRWTKQFFRWIRTHRRVRMVVYYQGYAPSWPFELARFRKSRAVIRTNLRSGLFVPFPREWMPSGTSK